MPKPAHQPWTEDTTSLAAFYTNSRLGKDRNLLLIERSHHLHVGDSAAMADANHQGHLRRNSIEKASEASLDTHPSVHILK